MLAAALSTSTPAPTQRQDSLHTRGRARARTHTRTHAHAHARTRARTHTRTHAHAHARTRARTHTRTHAHAHARTRAHPNPSVHPRALMRVCFHLVWRLSDSVAALKNLMMTQMLWHGEIRRVFKRAGAFSSLCSILGFGIASVVRRKVLETGALVHESPHTKLTKPPRSSRSDWVKRLTTCATQRGSCFEVPSFLHVLKSTTLGSYLHSRAFSSMLTSRRGERARKLLSINVLSQAILN